MQIEYTSLFKRHICTTFTTFAVVLSCMCAIVCWHGRSYLSVFPHHLWPPVEPWQGYCLQRSGPGRYNNQHLCAAQMRWWDLRWATPRSDCWAAGVGWERANSAGRETNNQLVRTWNRYNLKKNYKMFKQPPPPNSHIYCAHSHTHRSDYYSYSMNNFIYHLVKQPQTAQHAHSWWFGFISILGPSQRLHCVMKATFALVGFMTIFLSASIPQWFWAAHLPTETSTYKLKLYWILYSLSVEYLKFTNFLMSFKKGFLLF